MWCTLRCFIADCVLSQQRQPRQPTHRIRYCMCVLVYTGVPYALEELRQILKQQSTPDETCAVLIEPVLGEGGYVPAPDGFLSGIRDICDENDILLISDEVRGAGFGFGRDLVLVHPNWNG